MVISANPDILFVYGTLKLNADGKQHPLLQAADFLGTATLSGRLYLVADYPGALADIAAGEQVKGELYRLLEPAASFAALDAFEDAAAATAAECEYLRRIVPVTLADGTRIDAWTYLYNRPVAGLKRIISGEFIDSGGN